MTEELSTLPTLEGTKVYLLKGDRGDRESKYLLMYEFESAEVRDRHFPSPGEMSKEAQQFFGDPANAAIMEKWESFATPVDVIYTDYITMG